jgi:hypothetical protein
VDLKPTCDNGADSVKSGMLSVRRVLGRIKRAVYGSPPSEFNPRLAGLEKVFRSPPMTRELVRAIYLISPSCNFRPNESDRAIWEVDQNVVCWPEYEALQDNCLRSQSPFASSKLGRASVVRSCFSARNAAGKIASFTATKATARPLSTR